MIDKIFYVTAVYFLVGAIGILIANRGKEASIKKQRWIKYVTYLVIVNGIVSLLVYKYDLFKYLATFIALIGCYEVIKAGNGKLKTKTLIFSILIYLLIGAMFVFFSIAASRFDHLFVYTVVFCFDGFSQIVGQIMGKRKLSPKISPNKTVEGFIGGLIIATFTGTLFHNRIYEPWKVTMVLSFVICLACLGGDLLASYYKRKTGIKDYGNLIPGHGGILDRFDSFIAAGAFYMLFIVAYVYFFW